MSLSYLKLVLSQIVITSFLVSTISAQQPYLSERPDWAGMWFNINDVDFTGFEEVVAGRADRIQWKDFEKTEGNYDFSGIKSELLKAKNGNYYYYFVLWTGPSSPEWIYNKVPKVETDGNTSFSYFPYYLDNDYKSYLSGMFDTLAGTIASYPQELIDRLIFIQPGFGATGDRQLYKGEPLDPQYSISDEQYLSFMKEMTTNLVNSFKDRSKTANIRFLWNIDDYDGSEPLGSNKIDEQLFGKWMKENYNCQLRKQQYTIAVGYLNPNEIDQDNEQRDNFYGNSGRWGGNPEYVRGELNENETATTLLYKLNPYLFYYWTAISSVDRGLDGWELKVLKQEYKEAYSFSHRYSFYKKAEKSPVAFVALRDILDYSDTNRFPEDKYGSAYKSNESRVNNILAEYSSYGAKNDDNTSALNETGIAYLKAVTGYNDCLWNVIARNNRRFITQIDANETSAGYWRVGITDTQPYGRFCRGFDVENNKNTMYFDVDDNYFQGNQDAAVHRLKVRIVYYAEEEGSWKLNYHALGDSMKTAIEITNKPGKGWLSEEIYIDDALLDNGGINGADLILHNTGGTNCKFHLIEIKRDLIIPGNDKIKVSSLEIQNSGDRVLYVNEMLKLQTKVAPSNAGNQSLNWISSNPDVASINGFGGLKALAFGETTVKVSSHDGTISDSILITVIDPGFGQQPFGGIKRNIPGFIEAEEYDTGGEGISFYDTDEKNGIDFRPEDAVDFRVGGGDTLVTKTQDGEWLEYTVDAEEGIYNLTLHYISAWPEDCQVVFSIEGDEIARFSSFLSGPANNWDTLMSASIENIEITGGEDIVLRLSIEEVRGNVQLDAFEFEKVEIVNVTDIHITDCPTSDLTQNESHQFNVQVLPQDAFNKGVSWSTSSSTIASVDENGMLAAISEGEVTIVATSIDNQTIVDSCTFKVLKAPVPVSGISLLACPTDTVFVDSIIQLNFEITPEDADDQSVLWNSSNEALARVDQNGLVSAIAPGSVTISVKSNDGSYADECSMIVDRDNNVQLLSHSKQATEVYPNPCTDKLFFKFPNERALKNTSIYDPLGKLLISGSTKENYLEIDLSPNTENKILIVKVVSGQTTECFKVMVKH